MSEALLLFPPVVETNFGAYYPSAAYLAAGLIRRGHTIRQMDLNESFALWLLEDRQLQRFGTGDIAPFGTYQNHEFLACAARILEKNISSLFDIKGRHAFEDRPSSPAYLMQWLGSAFRTDLPVDEMTRLLLENDPIAMFWHSFAYDRLQAPAPDIVGLTIAMGPQLLPGLATAKAVRKRWPQARIVIGGPAISLMNESDLHRLLNDCVAIDAAVRFDGEKPFEAMLDQLEDREWAPRDISGTSSIGDDRQIVTVPPASDISLRDTAPAHYDIDLVSQLADPVFSVVQARGCYWGECSYCDFVELYEGSPSFRQRPLPMLLQEIEHIIETYGGRRFSLITEALPPAYARRFSEAILERETGISWSSFVMVHDKFDSALFDQLARSGCERLVVGLETMVDRVLSLVQKHAGRDANARFLDAAGATEVALTINLIPDLPTTTAAEAMAALDDIAQFSDAIDTVSVFPFEATRSSAVGREPERFGLVHGGETAKQAQFAANSMEYSDPAMTPEERRDVHAAYQSFANGINARPLPRSVPEGRFTVSFDELDIVHNAGKTQIFDWRQRDAVVIPQQLALSIQSLDNGHSMDRNELTRRMGVEEAERGFRLLEEIGVLRAVY